jgi:hypothetical protein
VVGHGGGAIMMYDKDAGYYSTLCGNVPVGEGRFWRLNINHPQHKDSEGNIRFTHQCTAIKTAEDVWIGQKFQSVRGLLRAHNLCRESGLSHVLAAAAAR